VDFGRLPLIPEIRTNSLCDQKRAISIQSVELRTGQFSKHLSTADDNDLGWSKLRCMPRVH